jgi:hypothetical protein
LEPSAAATVDGAGIVDKIRLEQRVAAVLGGAVAMRGSAPAALRTGPREAVWSGASPARIRCCVNATGVFFEASD